MKALLFLTIVMALSAIAEGDGDPATALLQASDRGRGDVKAGVTWKSKIITTEDDEKSEREFLVKAKDHDAYVEALQPARTKGEIYIFNDRNMWFYKPSLKKPVSISPRQKLTGQAANGDIASTHYARDYSATLEKTEKRDGVDFHVLLLKANAPNLTYDQIRYWISDKTKLALRAEFLTLQGKVFKIGEMEYGNSLAIDGKSLPFVSKLTITDAKFPRNTSVIEYSGPHVESHPDSLFKVNNLSR